MNAIAKLELTPATKRAASTAIEAMHAAFNAKGGLSETLQRAESQSMGVSSHIYGLARSAAKRGIDMDGTIGYFVLTCVYAESVYKQRHGVENLKDALPVWNVFKSNILRGMRLGLSVLDSPNEKAFRTRALERVAQDRTSIGPPGGGMEHPEEDGTPTTATGRPRAGPKVPVSMAEIEGYVETTTVREQLKTLVAQVVWSAEHIKSTRVTQAEEILREAWQKLGPLLTKRAAEGV